MTDATGTDRSDDLAATMPRFAQTFPVLDAAEIERVRRFGKPKRFAAGDYLARSGEPGPGMFVVLAGEVAIDQRDGLGHVTPIVEQGPGQFLAEVGQLSGQPALVDVRAETEVEALLIPPDQLRALLVAEAELGERMMRALILRRVALIESGVGGPVLIGPRDAPGLVALEGFLSRNGQPHHIVDPATDEDAAHIVAVNAPSPDELPLVVCPDGTILRNPKPDELARRLGLVASLASRPDYDVIVVGCGPAGLSTAVYAASEGLKVAVLDSTAFGGQAAASTRIENYLGFPTGISGLALAGRAYNQAVKFGAEILIPVTATALDCSRSDSFIGVVADGHRLRGRTVVIATGARYRRPDIARLAEFEGRGVSYWASPVEARLCRGQEVAVVGGGNSAGQAAVFLAAHTRKVLMLVRGAGLAAGMSRYLIDRITATPNIELLTETSVTRLDGPAGGTLTGVGWQTRGGAEEIRPIRNLFIFAGAEPATGWLADCEVTRDRGGFVLTGASGARDPAERSELTSSVDGVFAIGDVRAGSVKRVGSAIGEGAEVVRAIHVFLANLSGTGAVVAG